MRFLNIAIILRILLGFFQVFYAIFRDFLGFGILGFSKILGFFQRFFGIFDEVYEDFQSNLPLDHFLILQADHHLLHSPTAWGPQGQSWRVTHDKSNYTISGIKLVKVAIEI
jgi:hypothetical protein